MTRFQKQFVLKCLDFINTTLSKEEEIERVSFIYNQGKSHQKIEASITDSVHWSDNERIGLAGAVFEAIAHISFELCSQNDEKEAIEQATDLFLNTYLPSVTANTDKDNRLASVNRNVTEAILQVRQIPEPLSLAKIGDYSTENPYTFFTTAAAVGLGIVATTAFLLSK